MATKRWLLGVSELLMRVRYRHFIIGLILAVYAVLALALTYPFIRDPAHVLTAPIDSDVGYSSILFEAIKREGANPLTDGRVYTIAAPDGMKINTGVERVSFFSTLWLWGFTLLVNAVFAHSLMALLGYFLTASITFLFVLQVTRSRAIAFISGLIYGFFPLMLTLGRSGPPYTHMWLYILPVWAFWSLVAKGITKQRVIIAALSVLPGMYWTPYYTFHVLLVAGSCLAVFLYYAYIRQGALKAFGWGLLFGLFWLANCIAYYLIGTSSQYSEVPSRSIAEIYQQSAHPLMYLLPGMYSTFGQFGYRQLVTWVPRAGYTSLYLGLSCIVVALLAVRSLCVGRLPERVKVAAFMGLAVSVVVFSFSLPPTIQLFGMEVPTPGRLVAEFVPSLRAGQRLAMPLMGGAVILVAAGLYSMTLKMKPVKSGLVLMICTVVFFVDLASLPPQRTLNVAQPDIFAQLSEQPRGLAAQYNFSSLVSNPGQNICFPQFAHKMPIVNDCAMSRDPYDFDKPTKTLQSLIKLPLCQQIGQLAAMNVKYVIAKQGDTPITECLKEAKANVVLDDGAWRVYTIHK